MNKYKVLGIDPGSDTLGVSLMELDINDGTISLEFFKTLVAKKEIKKPVYKDNIEIHGPRYTRLQYLEQELVHIFHDYKPHAIICESPFLDRLPQAFETLVETKFTIRKAMSQYDRSIPLETVSPSEAKKAVGVIAKGSTKLDINIAINALPDIQNNTGYELKYMDEHSTDATAVAYFKIKNSLKEFIERNIIKGVT